MFHFSIIPHFHLFGWPVTLPNTCLSSILVPAIPSQAALLKFIWSLACRPHLCERRCWGLPKYYAWTLTMFACFPTLHTLCNCLSSLAHTLFHCFKIIIQGLFLDIIRQQNRSYKVIHCQWVVTPWKSIWVDLLGTRWLFSSTVMRNVTAAWFSLLFHQLVSAAILSCVPCRIIFSSVKSSANPHVNCKIEPCCLGSWAM